MWNIIITVGGCAIIALLMYNKVKSIWTMTQIWKAQKKISGDFKKTVDKKVKKYKPKKKLDKDDVMFN